MNPDRRTVLRAATTIGTALVAGCTGGGTDPFSTPTPHPDLTRDWTWEWSTDCTQTQTPPRGFRGVIIEVERAWETLEHIDPIRYANLTTAEQEILDTVIETGGYGTCDESASDAVMQFVDRVHTYLDADTERIFLDRDGVYYQLRIVRDDQVYGE